MIAERALEHEAVAAGRERHGDEAGVVGRFAAGRSDGDRHACAAVAVRVPAREVADVEPQLAVRARARRAARSPRSPKRSPTLSARPSRTRERVSGCAALEAVHAVAAGTCAILLEQSSRGSGRLEIAKRRFTRLEQLRDRRSLRLVDEAAGGREAALARSGDRSARAEVEQVVRVWPVKTPTR